MCCFASRQHEVMRNNGGIVLLGVGASAIPYDLGPIDIGKARRTGQSVSPNEDRQGFPQAEFAPDVGATASASGAAALPDTPAAVSGNGASASMSMESQVKPLGVWQKRNRLYAFAEAQLSFAPVCYDESLSDQIGLLLHLWVCDQMGFRAQLLSTGCGDWVRWSSDSCGCQYGTASRSQPPSYQSAMQTQKAALAGSCLSPRVSLVLASFCLSQNDFAH